MTEREKQSFRSMLKAHPAYDESKGGVVVKGHVKKEIDLFNVCRFLAWITAEIEKLPISTEEKAKLLCLFSEKNFFSVYADEDFAAIAREIIPEARVNMKKTRIIMRVCQKYGIDKIKDIRMATFITKRDYGFNYFFAMLGDALRQEEYDLDVVIGTEKMEGWKMVYYPKDECEPFLWLTCACSCGSFGYRSMAEELKKQFGIDVKELFDVKSNGWTFIMP